MIEPLTLASALCVVKEANTGTGRFHRAQVNNEYKGHTGYRGSAVPPLHTQHTPTLLAALLEAINR
jgi:hypothetical protein